MRIGIDISQIVYQTGVSRYTVELVKHLLELDQDNQYFLFAGSLRQKPTLRSFAQHLQKPRPKTKITSLSPHLVDFFWNRLNIFSPDLWLPQLDVFHASNWAIPPTRAKLITTIHDLTFLKYPQAHPDYSVAVHKRHLKRASKKAQLIITDSQATKKDLIKQGIKPDKIRVIYLAPAAVFKPVKDAKILKSIKAKYQLKKNYLLSVGTLEPRKNLVRLIKAYSRLPFRLKSKFNLVIVGKFGWGETTKPVPGVKLLGFVPDEDLAVLYSAAKVMVYPSIYEGFGLPVLEAMACGCPVITSSISSLPELGGKAALYLNPLKTDEITQTIKTFLDLSPARRFQLVRTSLAQAKQFSWKKTAQQTLKVYQEAFNADRS